MCHADNTPPKVDGVGGVEGGAKKNNGGSCPRAVDLQYNNK